MTEPAGTKLTTTRIMTFYDALAYIDHQQGHKSVYTLVGALRKPAADCWPAPELRGRRCPGLGSLYTTHTVLDG